MRLFSCDDHGLGLDFVPFRRRPSCKKSSLAELDEIDRKELIDLRNTLCAHNPKTTAGTTSTSS